MAFTTKAKSLLNAVLRPVNIRIDSLTAQKAEEERLVAYERHVGFEMPAYSVLPGIAEVGTASLEEESKVYHAALARLKNPAQNDTGYSPGNHYFGEADASVLYLMIRRFAPRKVVEVGCGNSTRVTRQAIIDAELDTKLVAIDPSPRTDIEHLVDEFVQERVETAPSRLFSDLESGDVLFIDSSHEVRAGNDVAHLFCRVIPLLAPGVVIHLHDIFLPYEYPKPFFYSYPTWGEQYLLHALISSGGYEILWPGHYLQRARPELMSSLTFLRESVAQSFWIKKVR